MSYRTRSSVRNTDLDDFIIEVLSESDEDSKGYKLIKKDDLLQRKQQEAVLDTLATQRSNRGKKSSDKSSSSFGSNLERTRPALVTPKASKRRNNRVLLDSDEDSDTRGPEVPQPQQNKASSISTQVQTARPQLSKLTKPTKQVINQSDNRSRETLQESAPEVTRRSQTHVNIPNNSHSKSPSKSRAPQKSQHVQQLNTSTPRGSTRFMFGSRAPGNENVRTTRSTPAVLRTNSTAEVRINDPKNDEQISESDLEGNSEYESAQDGNPDNSEGNAEDSLDEIEITQVVEKRNPGPKKNTTKRSSKSSSSEKAKSKRKSDSGVPKRAKRARHVISDANDQEVITPRSKRPRVQVEHSASTVTRRLPSRSVSTSTPIASSPPLAWDSLPSVSNRTRKSTNNILFVDGKTMAVFIQFKVKDRDKLAQEVLSMSGQELREEPGDDVLNLSTREGVEELKHHPRHNLYKFYHIDLLTDSRTHGRFQDKEKYLIYDPKTDRALPQPTTLINAGFIDSDDELEANRQSSERNSHHHTTHTTSHTVSNKHVSRTKRNHHPAVVKPPVPFSFSKDINSTVEQWNTANRQILREDVPFVVDEDEDDELSSSSTPLTFQSVRTSADILENNQNTIPQIPVRETNSHLHTPPPILLQSVQSTSQNHITLDKPTHDPSSTYFPRNIYEPQLASLNPPPSQTPHQPGSLPTTKAKKPIFIVPKFRANFTVPQSDLPLANFIKQDTGPYSLVEDLTILEAALRAHIEGEIQLTVIYRVLASTVLGNRSFESIKTRYKRKVLPDASSIARRGIRSKVNPANLTLFFKKLDDLHLMSNFSIQLDPPLIYELLRKGHDLTLYLRGETQVPNPIHTSNVMLFEPFYTDDNEQSTEPQSNVHQDVQLQRQNRFQEIINRYNEYPLELPSDDDNNSESESDVSLFNSLGITREIRRTMVSSGGHPVDIGFGFLSPTERGRIN